MSASERLAALNAEIRILDAGLKEARILETMPEIVAVVKRLEWCADAFDYISGRDVEGWDAGVPTEVVAIGARDQARLALAALEEKLST